MGGWLGHAGKCAARGLAVVVAAVAMVAAAPAMAQCQLCVAKSFSPASVPSGGKSTLTIRLLDADKLDALDSIAFSDAFPPGMTLVSAAASQCGGNVKPSGGGFTFTNGFLLAGQACSITAVVSATGPPGPLVNTTSIFDYNDVDVFKTEPATSGTLAILSGRAPIITSGAPPDGTVGAPYAFQVTVAGTAPITVTASGLPPGLILDPSTLRITGTPTVVGSFSGAIIATNGIKPNASQPFTILIDVPPLVITTPPSVFAAPATAGTPLDVMLQAQGGVPPYVWQLVGGALPPGVTLGGDGHLVGTPTAAGTFVFAAGVTDARGTKTTQSYTIVVVKGSAVLQVTTAPSPVISGQTLTVTATLIGPVVATGTVDVWVAGSAARCPAPFKFGNPSSPVPPARTAPLDATGKARVAVADLAIDDYGVCVHYSGDALYNEAFAGPLDAFVIKGVLLAAPVVALAAPARAKANSSVAVDVAVTPVDTTLVPSGSVEIRRDGQTVATVDLVNGVAHATVTGPVDANVAMSAVYMGDGMFPPAASVPHLILLDGVNTDLTIPTLSQSLLALLAILLGFLAARRLRR